MSEIKNQKMAGFAWIPAVLIAAVLIALVAIGSALLYFPNSAKAPSQNNDSSDKISSVTPPATSPVVSSATTSTTVATVAAKLTTDSKGVRPEDFLRKIRVEFDATKSFAELEAFNLKYASQKYAAEIIKARTAYGTLSAEVLENLFKVAKKNLPSSAEIGRTSSTATDKNVTLKISTSKNSLEGTVALVLENGEWKVDSEAWAKTN